MVNARFIAAALTLILVLPLWGQTTWKEYPNNPVITANIFIAMDPAVVYDSVAHVYRMWYTADSEGRYVVFYATSPDGLKWTKNAANPVLKPGAQHEWDGIHTRCSAVLFDGQVYRMYYMGTGANTREQIGLATSSDGIHWQKYQHNPVLRPGAFGAWDQVLVYHPEVFLDGGKFYMWYAGYNGAIVRGGLAISSDGIQWNKHDNNPVLDIGVTGAWDDYSVWPNGGIARRDGRFYLLYSASSSNNPSRGALGLATSSDGVSWTKYSHNPVLQAGTGSWNQAGLGPGSMLFDGQVFKLWFAGHGGPSDSWHIGYAESFADSATLSDYALQFDGADDLVQIDDLDNKLDLADFTLEAWVYRREENKTEEIIHKGGVGENPSVNTNYALLFREDNFARAHFEYADSRNIEVVGTTRTSIGKWYHLAGVHSSAEKTLKIYVNGVLDAPPLPTEGLPNQQNSPLRLGANDPGWNLDENFNGLIDEVRIWKRSRTQVEIQTDMNNTLQGNEDGLVAYWRLNEGEGQVVHDLTPNAIPGHRGLSENADTADPMWVLANRTLNHGCSGIPLPAGEAYGNLNANHQTHMDKITYCFDGQSGDRYLSFAVYDIDHRDEVSVSLNGETLMFALLTANNTWSSLAGVLLSDAQIHDGQPNTLVFDNLRNPPQTWRYGVRQVSVDPFYALPLPAALGNIPGGDTQHADKVVYFFSGRGGDLNLAYQIFDIDHIDEVDIVLNDTKVKDETLTSDEAWSETRTLLLPDELVHNNGVNVLIFENTKNPPRNWRWGVRNVSASVAAASSLALAGQMNASVNGQGVLNGRYLMDGELAPPLREHGDPVTDTSHYVIQGAATIATNGHALIQLPSSQKIDYLTLYPEWHAARYFSYRIETSSDGSNWSTALDRMNVKLRGPQTECIAKTNVRYLRLTGASFIVDPDSSLLNGLSESEYWQNYASLLQQAQPEALAIAELVLLKQEGNVQVDEPALEVPKQYQLAQNLPNPFNPSTIIRFDLPQQERVHLAIYNLRGELVATLVDGNLNAGAHAFTFDARGLATGVYFYRVTTERFSATKKMLLAK